MLKNSTLADFMLNQESENQVIKTVKKEHMESTNPDNFEDFQALCAEIKEFIEKEDLKTDSDETIQVAAERLRNALLGKKDAVEYYIQKITEYLSDNNKFYITHPSWYDDLAEAVFHEVWGFAGIWEWIKHGKSSSCKVIQPRIYFMDDDDHTVLKPQTISEERFIQLKRRLLINDTSQKESSDYQEIYMVDGTRIEIFNNHKESSGAGVIVFRRYTLKEYNFEKLAELKTIGNEAIPLLKAMVPCGFNMNVIGPVRSGKTGFMTTYQTYEDPRLEGVFIETDPEVPFHEIMPEAPIMQLIADNEKMDGLIKPLMRSDADYIIQGESRDGAALRLMLMITKKGTRRVKGTFHTGQPHNFCYDAAQEIVNIYGGSIWAYMIQFAENFNFLFEMAPDSRSFGRKRLMGIHEIQFDEETFEIKTNAICKFDREKETWSYNANLSTKTREDGMKVSIANFQKFENILKQLAEQYPMTEKPIRVSPYSRLIGRS